MHDARIVVLRKRSPHEDEDYHEYTAKTSTQVLNIKVNSKHRNTSLLITRVTQVKRLANSTVFIWPAWRANRHDFRRCTLYKQNAAPARIICFWVSYFPNASCVLNLKLLASTVAEISRGSEFFGYSLSPAGPLPILVVKVVSW